MLLATGESTSPPLSELNMNRTAELTTDADIRSENLAHHSVSPQGIHGGVSEPSVWSKACTITPTSDGFELGRPRVNLALSSPMVTFFTRGGRGDDGTSSGSLGNGLGGGFTCGCTGRGEVGDFVGEGSTGGHIGGLTGILAVGKSDNCSCGSAKGAKGADGVMRGEGSSSGGD